MNEERMNVAVHPLVLQLREHADRVAGGGPSESNYDPETLILEHAAADEVERLVAAIAKHRATFPDEALEGERELWATISMENALGQPPDTGGAASNHHQPLK